MPTPKLDRLPRAAPRDAVPRRRPRRGRRALPPLVEAALPSARVYYAVKANPATPVLRTLLVDLGSAFDVASPAEIDALPRRRRRSRRPLVRQHHQEGARHRRRRIDAASRRFTVDAEAELDKVLDARAGRRRVRAPLPRRRAAPTGRCRGKFGCDARTRPLELLDRRRRPGRRRRRVFHVGSQQRDRRRRGTTRWRAVARVRRAPRATAARRSAFLNLGGGFPGPLPRRRRAGRAVRRGDPPGAAPARTAAVPELMVEPGRYLVADAGVLRTEVVLVSRRSLDERRWVYLDCGRLQRAGRDARRGDPLPPAHRPRRRPDRARRARRADLRLRRRALRQGQLPAAAGLAEGDLVDSCRPAPTRRLRRAGLQRPPAPAEHYI